MSDREVVSSRIFAAPRALVFEAFRDPRQLAQWWGPKGFAATIHEFDLRPGGRWRVTLHGPDKTDYPNDKVFTEVVPEERIVFQHRQAGHDFEMTMTYVGEGAQTTLTWVLRFETSASLASLQPIIREANEQNFDRLAAHLQKTQSQNHARQK